MSLFRSFIIRSLLLEQLNLRPQTDEELGVLVHELLQCDVKMIYRPGSHNVEADCLSRKPDSDESMQFPKHGTNKILFKNRVNRQLRSSRYI